jgi:hypothetical protein
MESRGDKEIWKMGERRGDDRKYRKREEEEEGENKEGE